MNSILAAGLVASRAKGGISAALVKSDGEAEFEVLHALELPFTSATLELIDEATDAAGRLAVVSDDPVVDAAAHIVTQLLYEGYRQLLRQSNIDPTLIEVVGGHGCIVGEIAADFTHWHIGDFGLIARETGKPIWANFQRRVDDNAAPLALDAEAIDGASLAYVAVRQMMFKDVMFPAGGGGVIAMSEGQRFSADIV